MHVLIGVSKKQVGALLWQPGGTKRIAKRCCKRRSAIDARELSTVAKRGVQFQNPRRGSPGFFQPPEFRERRGQLHIGDAVCRVGLNGPVSCMSSFFITAAVEMAHCLCVKRGPSPGIERAEPQTLLAPFDGALGFPSPPENDAAENVAKRR